MDAIPLGEPGGSAVLPAPPAFPDDATRAVVNACLRRPLAQGGSRSLRLLFTEGRTLALAPVETDLGDALKAFRASGLLVLDGGRVRSSVALESVEGLFFASDRRDDHRDGALDYVLGLGGVTRRIAELMPRRTGSTMLDLGCGCGVLAILSAQTAASATAVDINPRAVAFTRFNAALNDAGNVEALIGDLYQPVVDRQFDLIVSNAPYVISPDSTFRYRDGGVGFCERMARATPAHLAEAGCALLAANWPEIDGRPWQADLAGWFEQAGCDTWVLCTGHLEPDEYAQMWLMQEHRGDVPTAALNRWVDSYRDAGFIRLHSGYCLLSRAAGREPWVEMRDLPPCDGLGGAAFDRVLAARDSALRHDDAALCVLALSPIAGLEAIERRRPGPLGWQVESVDIRPSDGLRFTLRIDPVAADLLGWLDGTRSAADAAHAFAIASGRNPQTIVAALPALLRSLLEAGLITDTTLQSPSR